MNGLMRESSLTAVLYSTRLCSMLLRNQAREVQHMQKSLVQMNVQLAKVISDIVGTTGQQILRAIIAGERNEQSFYFYALCISPIF